MKESGIIPDSFYHWSIITFFILLQPDTATFIRQVNQLRALLML